MKVWITRPASDAVFMGGLRDVLLWIDEPHFSHCCRVLEAELFDPGTNTCVMGVYREDGWGSIAGSLKAKEFLSQNETVQQMVWKEICDSMISWECPDPMEYNTDSPLLRPNYEKSCSTNWKRFLLEVDLKNETVERISPMVCYLEGERSRGLPLRESTAISSSYLDGDFARPYFYNDRSLAHLEVRTEHIW
jgi:hypothetical protein